MKKEFRINRLFLLCVVSVLCFSKAQAVNSDSVIMTVAGKEVLLSEFLYMAAKNNEVDLSNKKSLDAYVELFKNFKLKVADAESAGLDKTSSFTNEFTRYRAELTASYMSDAKGEEDAVRMIYDRGQDVLELSYILFRFPGKVVSKDTVPLYQAAYNAYKRVQTGEDFKDVADKLIEEQEEENSVGYEHLASLLPLTGPKTFENVAYSLKEGEVSLPVMTPSGYYLIKLHKRKPNLGQVHVSHILLRADEGDEVQEKQALEKANEIRDLVIAGEDFEELAKEFSQDVSSAKRGGVLPLFTQGRMVAPFELAAFELKEVGEISQPVKSPYGYHLIKLYEKKPRASFDEEKGEIASVMKKGEWNFEYYDVFDQRLKQEYNYKFYADAYKELQTICNDHFPTDSTFFINAESLNDKLFVINDITFTQKEFCLYLLRHPFSTKTYSGDFMKEVYDLFIRDIVTSMERESLETKYPEYVHLLQEYRDGILLFNVSNARVWEHPVEEQARLEKTWMEDIQKRYPVIVNKKLLKKIKKH